MKILLAGDDINLGTYDSYLVTKFFSTQSLTFAFSLFLVKEILNNLQEIKKSSKYIRYSKTY